MEPSDFHLFPELKKWLGGRRYDTYEELESSIIIKQIFNIHWCFFYDQSEVEKKTTLVIIQCLFQQNIREMYEGINEFEKG